MGRCVCVEAFNVCVCVCVCVCGGGFNSQSIFAVINNWSAGRRAAAAGGGGGVKGLLHLANKKKTFGAAFQS